MIIVIGEIFMPEEKDTVQASITEIAKFVKQKTEEMNTRLEQLKVELQSQIISVSSSDNYSKSLTEFEENLKKYAQNWLFHPEDRQPIYIPNLFFSPNLLQPKYHGLEIRGG